ncbi:MAG: hypothetical protein R3C03_17505 [Pirellulaceae bacterium]
MVGNLGQSRVKVAGNVRTLYSSVRDWEHRLDPDSPNVPAGGTRITCDEIDVNRWQPRDADHPVTEVVASGNSRVMGELFEATAATLKFDEMSGFLTIEGDDRNSANLWHQANRNASRNHLSATKIRYRPADGSTVIDDVKHASVGSNNGLRSNR